jgi:DNA mismatch repair protein MutL
MSIRILLPEVASQIAAGEVIERPASAVKELVENSLDARATKITINVSGAGQKLVEVADDGVGIPADELALAVERHATSKLSQAEELFQIATLGFRGEALASMASVSHLVITSRTIDTNLGARLRVEGGRIGSLESVGAPIGTLVRIENLFYNVPARLKFLKSDTTERRLIDKLVTRYALAYPNVRFHLRQEEHTVHHTSGSGDRREVLAALYGADIARQMLEVLYEGDQVRIAGFISPSSLTRTHRREIYFYVNGRPVQEISLSTALIKGYHTLLMVGRYPLAALFLETPPERVDVNVHPTKAEVRFREPERMFGAVQSAVRRALLAHNPVPGIGDNLHWVGAPDWETSIPQRDQSWQPDFQSGASQVNLEKKGESLQHGYTKDVGPKTATPGPQSEYPSNEMPILRSIGQIANAYLVAEGPDGLYLIDQHAAHERVLFERLMSQRNSAVPSQTLLHPAAVELSADQAHLLAQQLPFLERFGFQVESFGPNTFLVRMVPVILMHSNPALILRSLVETFEEDETPLQQETEARLIARICKRSAVKAGAVLSPEEQRTLLMDLENCESPRTCPHGRPTMIHLSVDLLERQFGRRGPR